MLITFEGGEGSGKTTQIALLKDALERQGKNVVITREPGGTPEAEKIRDLLVQREGGDWTPLAETMLFFTARHMHVETLIKPALSEGKTVLCDRFTDSTMAYQGYGHGFDFGILRQIQTLTIGDFEPDLTFILDIAVEKGLTRAGKRLSTDHSTEDRFEHLDLSFHDRLRDGYVQIAAQNPRRCRIIQADQPIDDIHNEILGYLR